MSRARAACAPRTPLRSYLAPLGLLPFLSLFGALALPGGKAQAQAQAQPQAQAQTAPQGAIDQPLAAAKQTGWRELQIVDGVLAADQRLIVLRKGEVVRWRIRSTQPGALHIHAYRQSVALQAGVAGELSFLAYATGRFRVEWHPAVRANADAVLAAEPRADPRAEPRTELRMGMPGAAGGGDHRHLPLAVLEVRPN